LGVRLVAAVGVEGEEAVEGWGLGGHHGSVRLMNRLNLVLQVMYKALQVAIATL
jgi:hypothetical protein